MLVFDMDGVLVDTEPVWDATRRAVTSERGGTWSPTASTDMLGMSSPEWAAYLIDELGAHGEPAEIIADVERDVLDELADDLPWMPGAREAVARLARTQAPLAIASSANRAVIDRVVTAGLGGLIAVTVSSEEVERGKPAPDVYLEAARRLGVPPQLGVAVEDSTNGLISAAAAGFAVVAYPNARTPPAPESLARASAVIGSLGELTDKLISRLRA